MKLETIEPMLVEAGLVPVDARPSVPSKPLRPGEDLLPFLNRRWEASSQALTPVASWLRAERDRGGQLTAGFSGTDPHAVTTRIGSRLVWWPAGVIHGNLVGVASSRLGRRLDSQISWFSVLRAVCAQVDRDRDPLLVIAGTAAASFVARAAELFQLRALEVQLPGREAMTLARWVRRIMKHRKQEADPSGSRCVLSPRWKGAERANGPTASNDTEEPGGAGPLRDRVLVSVSDRLFVLRARRKGHIERLIDDRLSDPSWSSTRLYIALGEGLVDRGLADRWMDAGAIGWIVPNLLEADDIEGPPDAADVVSTDRLETVVVPVPDVKTRPYLIHCTRRHDGPWPEQSFNDYLDALILHRADADRSALAALTRILRERRLVASETGIRGGSRVVSFSAVPLDQLHRLRIYRSHRGRWDFEPYGIAIDRSWLEEEQGARPVHYGDDATWESLDPEQRAFFQVAQSTSRGTRTAIDWTVEQEWRHLGDVDLTDVPANKALVFVGSQEEAEQLARFSPWPVAVA